MMQSCDWQVSLYLNIWYNARRPTIDWPIDCLSTLPLDVVYDQDKLLLQWKLNKNENLDAYKCKTYNPRSLY